MKKGSVKGRDIGKISDVDINVDCVVHVHHDSMRLVVRKKHHKCRFEFAPMELSFTDRLKTSLT